MFIIDDVSIVQVNKTKLLGVVINLKLNWNDHIQPLVTKLVKRPVLSLESVEI